MPPQTKKQKTEKIKNIGKTTTLKLTEKFDREGLCKIIALIRNGTVDVSGNGSNMSKEDAQSSPEERTQRVLTKLEILRREGRDYLTTSYHRALFDDGTPFGREHASGFNSQGMPRAIRAAMFGRIKKDIDEVDAHPALLASLYDMPVLKDYHINRDDYLLKVRLAHDVSRDDAKSLFLSVLNRKNPKTFYSCWLREQKDGDVIVRAALTADPEIEAFANNLSNEVAVWRKQILSEPHHKKYSEVHDPDDHEGCFFNRLLCTWEYESLNVVIKMLEERGYIVDNRIHDGCHIVDDQTEDLSSALNEINEKIEKTWPLLKVKSKDFVMPVGFDDIEPEWRSNFNSSQAGPIDVISIKDIFDMASRASKKTYASKAAMYRALKGLCLEMNRHFAKGQFGKSGVVIEKRLGERRVIDGTVVDTVENMHRNFNATKYMYMQELTHTFKYKGPEKEGVKAGDEQEETHTVHLLDYWYNHFEGALYFNREVFNPRPPNILGSAGIDELNNYEGFTVAPSAKSEEDIKENIQPWIDNIKETWAKNNKEKYDYIFDWFAHLIQKPWEKTRVAMVVLGEKGATKGVTVAPIVKLVGPHAVELTQGDHAAGNFNSVLLDTTLVVMNEASYGGNKSQQGTMRGLITDDLFAATMKGIDTQANVVSYHNWIYMSNHPWVIPNTPGERRYFCVELDPKWSNIRKTPEYKAHIDKLLAVDPACLLRWLLDRDISSFNPHNYPETEAGVGQMEQSLTDIQSFMLGVLRGDVTLKECGLVQEQMGHTRSNVKGTEEIKYHTRWTFVDSIFEETAVQEAPDKFQWHRTGGIKVHKGNFYDAYVQSCRGNGKASSQSTAFWSNLRKTTPEYGCGMTCFNNSRKAKVDRHQHAYEDMVTKEEAIKMFRIIVGDQCVI